MKIMPDLIPVEVSGVYRGIAMITPDEVETPKNPPLWSPHARIQVDLVNGSEAIYSATWTSSGISGTIGVYKSGLNFPNICPVTLNPPEKEVIVEAAVIRRSLGKVQFNHKDANKIITALSSDRYWLVIPFSKNHGIKDRAIGITSLIIKNNRNTAVIMIKKKEYAQEFKKLNLIMNGRWLSMKHILMRNFGLILTFVGIGVFIGNLMSKNAGSAVYDTTIPLIISIIVAISGIVLSAIGMRGEKL